jgi:Flp pilus assembly protein TadD
MARHHVHGGDHEAALRLLDAVTTLDPLHHEAWMLTASIARRAGDAELAERADIEAAATSAQGPGPFAVKGVAEG